MSYRVKSLYGNECEYILEKQVKRSFPQNKSLSDKFLSEGEASDESKRKNKQGNEVQILKSVCTQNIKTLKSKEKMDGRNNKLNCVYVRSFLFDRQVAFIGKNKAPIDSQQPTRSHLSKQGLSDFTRVEK